MHMLHHLSSYRNRNCAPRIPSQFFMSSVRSSSSSPSSPNGSCLHACVTYFRLLHPNPPHTMARSTSIRRVDGILLVLSRARCSIRRRTPFVRQCRWQIPIIINEPTFLDLLPVLKTKLGRKTITSSFSTSFFPPPSLYDAICEFGNMLHKVSTADWVGGPQPDLERKIGAI